MKGVDQDSIDKIIEGFRGKRGKKFEERVAAFEELHDSSKETFHKFEQHAKNIALGTDKADGAYHFAYAVLNKVAEKPTDKITDDKKLAEIMEAYVDRSLEQIDKEYNGQIDKLKKEKKLSAEELRKLKGSIFAVYHPGEKGALNILDPNFLKDLKGKSKLEIAATLTEIAGLSTKNYAGYLTQKASEDLLKAEDIWKLSPYVKSKIKEAGYTHKDHHFMRHKPNELPYIYGKFLSGADIREHGYQRKIEEKKKVA